MSIEFIRKVAELHLCPDCFEKYKRIIEPSLRVWRASPLGVWNQTEWMIESILMKLEGAYKDEKTIIVGNRKEMKNSPEVNSEAYSRIENKWPSFKRRIDYLKKKGVLSKNTYKILDIARKRRNKIHDVFDFRGIKEEDYKLFESVSPIVENLFMAILLYPDREDMFKLLFSNAEMWAKNLLESLS